MAEKKRELRLDLGEIKLDAQKTPEGYLRAVAKVTRTGVFPYLAEDGSVRYELRHPDDVFSKASLDSLKNVPITVEHPRQMLNAANAKQLSVGHVTDSVHVDAPFVVAELLVTDAEAIRAIEAGKQELSCGYFVDVSEDAGVYEGQAYTHRQTAIRENHLAITDRARLGAELRIDSDVPYSVRTTARTDSTPSQEKNMVKVTINGIPYECAPEVANELTRLNAANETLSGEKTALAGKLDTMTADRDDKKAKLDAAVAAEPGKVAAAAQARAALVLTASKVLDEEAASKLDSMSDLDIKKAVILAKDPKVKLDGQTETYVQVRFDLATENLDAEHADAALAESRGTATQRQNGGDGKTDPDARRDAMIQRLKDRSVGKKTEGK